MTGFAVVASGLTDVESERRWVEDDKAALYAAAELAVRFPLVIAGHAIRKGGKIIKGESLLVYSMGNIAKNEL